MDLDTLLQTLNPATIAYFIFGFGAGYLLRSFQGSFRSKRTGRYAAIKTEISKERSAVVVESVEPPAYDLPDTVLGSLTARRSTPLVIEDIST